MSRALVLLALTLAGCAAIPPELIESELFGHERGAFTGANTRASGRFEQAEGGTLFLDEIGDMPMEAQTRLLRVLQQGEYTTVGGRTPIKTDVRIVAASNKDLRILIQQGLFREDLFFRLNVVPLRLPPLRERIEDLPDLIRHFFSLAEKDGLPPKKLDTAALERLKQHRWPGNVRELENTMHRAAILASDNIIRQAHLVNIFNAYIINMRNFWNHLRILFILLKIYMAFGESLRDIQLYKILKLVKALKV